MMQQGRWAVVIQDCELVAVHENTKTVFTPKQARDYFEAEMWRRELDVRCDDKWEIPDEAREWAYQHGDNATKNKFDILCRYMDSMDVKELREVSQKSNLYMQHEDSELTVYFLWTEPLDGEKLEKDVADVRKQRKEKRKEKRQKKRDLGENPYGSDSDSDSDNEDNDESSSARSVKRTRTE